MHIKMKVLIEALLKGDQEEIVSVDFSKDEDEITIKRPTFFVKKVPSIWKPSKEHNWEFDKRGFHKNKHGDWYTCKACSSNVFFWDGCNEFQKRLSIIFSFTEIVLSINKNERMKRTIPAYQTESGMEKGYHGILSEDCAEAQKFLFESVHLS